MPIIKNTQQIVKPQTQVIYKDKQGNITRIEQNGKVISGTPQKTDVQRTQEQAQSAAAIRQEATNRGVDISTPLKEQAFIKTISNEPKQSQVTQQLTPELKQKILDLKQEKIYTLSNIQLAKNISQRQTSENYGPKFISPEIQINPYIKKEVTNYQKIENKNIPIVKYTYVNPTVLGKQEERPATTEEVKQYQDYEKALSLKSGTASTNKLPVYKPALDSIENIYNTLNNNVKESITYPIFAGIEKVSKIDITNANQMSQFTPSILGIGGFGIKLKPEQDIIAGFSAGILRDIKEEPLKQIALYGTGAGLGAAFKGGATALSTIPKVGKGASTVFKTGAISYGIYQTAGAIGATSISASRAKNMQDAGDIIGLSVKDLALIGIGFKGGEKGFDIVKGEIKLKGQPEIKGIKQGVYPESPIDKQLDLFQKNIIEGLSYDPLNKIDIAKQYAEFNLKEQLRLKGKSQYPTKHAYPHLKEVAINTQKIIDAYPELHQELINEYGSIAKAKAEISKGGFLHDLLKVSSSSKNEYFGMPHGEILYELYRTGNLPEGIKLRPKVAKAIKLHEITFPKNPSAELRILSTADRLNFNRFSQGVNKELLPLKDAVERLQNLNTKDYKLPDINFDKDTSNFLKKYKISQGKIYPKEAKAVSFHTTPDIFYKKGKIIPKSGKSEVGNSVYTSTYVSTEFAEITGSKGELPKSLEAFKRAILKAIAPERSPGVAAFKPEGFRYSNVRYSKIPLFEGQRMVKGKGYAEFINAPEQGVLDIPRIKTEIEALARTSFEGGKTKGYLKIKGVKVPVDLFEPIKEQLTKNSKEISESINKKFNKEIKSKKYNSQEYSGYEEPSRIPSITSSSFSNSIQSDIISLQNSISKSLSSSENTSKSSISSISKTKNTSNISKVNYNEPTFNIYSIPKGTSENIKSYEVYPKFSSAKNNVNKYPKSTNTLPQEIIKQIINTPILKYQQKQTSRQQKSNLGRPGYNVFGKQLKSNRLFQINHSPLTKSRAEDVGSYYVTMTLAKTFIIRKSNYQAQEDYEFMYIPNNYFKSQEYKLRNYRIKNRQPINYNEERFIQKGIYGLSTESEKRQIQAFRKQVQSILQ
jgi:hypothetical protein